MKNNETQRSSRSKHSLEKNELDKDQLRTNTNSLKNFEAKKIKYHQKFDNNKNIINRIDNRNNNLSNKMNNTLSYSWPNEWNRLSKLYNSELIDGESSIKFVNNLKVSIPIKFSLFFQPSDPEFPFSKLIEYKIYENLLEVDKSPIKLFITVPVGYPKENIENIKLEVPEYKYIAYKFEELFRESINLTKNKLFPIYESLKLFDKNLSNFVNEKLPSIEEVNEQMSLSWSSAEQKLLEEAICYYKYTKDVNKKWNDIANHVGNGRTVKECINRYKYCRSLVIKKSNEKSEVEKKSEVYLNQQKKELSNELDLEGIKKLNLNNFEYLIVNNLNLISIDIIIIAVLRLQIYCSRCNEINDYKPISIPGNQDLNIHLNDHEMKKTNLFDNLVLGNSNNCKKCNIKHTIHFCPLMCHLNDDRIGKIEFSECILRDILPMDILISCSNCGTYLKIRDFFFGKQYSVNCRNCFKELGIKVDGISLGEDIFNLDESTDFLLEELGNRKIKKKVKKDTKLPTSIGSPLPLNGTCSHYKKSNRWNRFPCCNKAYPCHYCHDKDNPDHNYEWAKQMICGFCSREQNFSEKCKYCQLNLIGKTNSNSSGRFWEGGKGCRNPITLSNKDSRKHKLISRHLKKIK